MKDNLTFIAYVLDRSLSMRSIKDATIDGFNRYVVNQKESAEDEVLFTLAQFDHEYRLSIDGAPIKDVQLLNNKTYVPRGNTALLDAIGFTIDAVGDKLRKLPEHDRPSKVLIIVQTDGQENCSCHYSAEKVKGMIDLQRNKYNWDFVFAGASEESVLFAQELGYAANMTNVYGADAVGTQQLFDSMAAGTNRYRGAGGVVLTRSLGYFNQ